MASLVNDGANFFPHILNDSMFQKDGLIFGNDPGESGTAKSRKANIDWGVVDPRRYLMYVWQKKENEDDFTDAAKKLNAEIVTNGSFNEYQGGENSKWTAFKYSVHAYGKTLKYLFWDTKPITVQDQELKQLRKDYFKFSNVQGEVISANEGIHVGQKVQPNWGNAYFGRKTGRTFADYEVGRGDAPAIAEVISGLFRTVDDFVAVEKDNKDGDQTIGAGYYGLAPFGTASAPASKALQDAGIVNAVTAYLNAEPKPTGKALPSLDGLILIVFGWESTQHIAELMAAAQVKEAVRIDGNDSILFGHQNTLIVGETMSEYKRLYNKYGYRFEKN